MIKSKVEPYRLRIKLDLGGGVMGPGKAELMKKIDEFGSISAAARKMGINYRRAWFLLETLNDPLGEPVVITVKGGSAGGGTNLSPSGRAILDAYEICVDTAQRSTVGILENLHTTLAK